MTKEAFNALLKTLEEPPAHVIFILATTEQDKLPGTVVSRCQSFVFRKPSQNILKDVTLNISKKEGYKIDPSAAQLIAILGDGSFRDTLGMIQKVISTSVDKKITAEEVEMITGAPPRDLVNNFIVAIAENNLDAGLAAINKAAKNNINMKIFLKLILAKFRFILLLCFAKEMESEIKKEVDEDDFNFFKKMKDSKSAKLSAATLSKLLDVHLKLDFAYIAQLPLELALIEILTDENK